MFALQLDSIFSYLDDFMTPSFTLLQTWLWHLPAFSYRSFVFMEG